MRFLILASAVLLASVCLSSDADAGCKGECEAKVRRCFVRRSCVKRCVVVSKVECPKVECEEVAIDYPTPIRNFLFGKTRCVATDCNKK